MTDENRYLPSSVWEERQMAFEALICPTPLTAVTKYAERCHAQLGSGLQQRTAYDHSVPDTERFPPASSSSLRLTLPFRSALVSDNLIGIRLKSLR